MTKLLFFRKHSDEHVPLRSFLSRTFGIKTSNIDYYALAFRHKSVAKKTTIIQKSNERLEFLGDSVISTIVSEYLYEKYPIKSEGFLTQMRSKIVNRNNLNSLGKQIGVEPFILYKKGPKEHKSLLGNVFEALIGAIYLDKGYKKTKSIFIESIINKYLDLDEIENTTVDFKSQLLMHCQKNKFALAYKIQNEEIVNSTIQFTIGVYINDELKASATASSKRKAEQKASEIVISLM